MQPPKIKKEHEQNKCPVDAFIVDEMIQNVNHPATIGDYNKGNSNRDGDRDVD